MNKHVIEMAKRNAESYFDYANKIFDDFIAKDVALLCCWGDYSNSDLDDGNVRATLPAKPMKVFLGNCCFLYFQTIKKKLMPLTYQQLTAAQWPKVFSRQKWMIVNCN